MSNDDRDVPEAYEGREHSRVKHTVLESYLMRLLMIVGQHRAETLGYVDCFAGPWKSESEDLSDTSIDIALRQMKKSHDWFADRDASGVPDFKAVFVEKDEERYARLDEYLDQRRRELPENLDLYSHRGNFRHSRDEILEVFDDRDFVFFFIDPTGWKHVTPDVLQPFLRRPNSELLITFMFDFVNRFPRHIEEVTGVTEREVRDLSGTGREREVLAGYRKRLKTRGNDDLRTAYVRVKDPAQERTKYHLVYVTQHPKGVVTFMEESEEAEREEQPILRAARAARESKQTSLLQPGAAADDPQRMPTEDLREVWLDALSEQPRVFDEEDFADLLERTDCFPSELQEAFHELWEAGRVENISATDESMKRRTKNFVDFENGEQLALATGGSDE